MAKPLRAVDDVNVLSATEAVATKRIVADDPYLAGHFPGRPIYPGVFVVESVRQAADAMFSQLAGSARVAALAEVRALRLLAPLVPGDVLTIHLRCETESSGMRRVSATCSRDDGQRVAQVELEIDLEVSPARSPHVLNALPGEEAALPGQPVEGPVQTADLLDVLPQRPPMLLVDRVGSARIQAGGLGSTMWGLKAITAAEPCYDGLDKDADDAYPAALLLESFLQSAAVLWVRAVPDTGDGTLVLGGVRQVSFPAPVRPGDVVRHRLRLDTVRAGTAFLSGYTEVVGVPDRPVLIAESVVIARRKLEPAPVGGAS